MLLDLDKLDCCGCPSEYLLKRHIDHIRDVENLREIACNNIRCGSVRLILLCESAPHDKFIYDLSSPDTLREYLQNELVGEKDPSVLNYMSKRGVWIVDCSLCPINLFRKEFTNRMKAATNCLRRHTKAYLQAYPNAKIITIFPQNCGLYKRELPASILGNRLITSFKFSNLQGLKKIIESVPTL